MKPHSNKLCDYLAAEKNGGATHPLRELQVVQITERKSLESVKSADQV